MDRFVKRYLIRSPEPADNPSVVFSPLTPLVETVYPSSLNLGSVPFADLLPAVIDLLDNQAHWMLICPFDLDTGGGSTRYWQHLRIEEVEKRASSQLASALVLNDHLNRLAAEYMEGSPHVQ